MKLDPTKMADCQISEAAEAWMKKATQLGDELGLKGDELIPMGHYVAKVDFMSVLKRLKNQPNAKYVNVTAITPTPLGEGKTTSAMGLVEGLGKRKVRVTGAIRQPSGGPTFNIKGSAAGGGIAQCIPLTAFSLGLTGDIDRVTNAHNLALVALTSRMQHEYNYDNARLKESKLKRLDVDSRRAERMGKIVVAFNKQGEAVTTADLEVDGAMTALMVASLNPNLMQTVEGQPVFVHAGPFANIAVGQSSIVAGQIGLKLSDYHITESGFGADIGFEKFWNIKCRVAGLKPHCAVLVATIRALKMHGGGPKVSPGRPLDEAYQKENVPLVATGCENLVSHIERS